MRLNPANERIKHEYFEMLEEVRQLGTASVDSVAKSIDRFEDYTGRKDFGTFHRGQARGFKQALAAQLGAHTGEPLSKATILMTLKALKAFFSWLTLHPGYRRKIELSDVGYFNLSLRDTAIATARREPRVATVEQIRQALSAMPIQSDLDRRDRATIAFTLLTGARDSATASMRVKHVDLEERLVTQDAREVRTKFSKTFPTFFFPVGGDIEEIVVDWVSHLKTDLRFGPNDPLFPSTKLGQGPDGNFTPIGLTRECWATATPIRAIFKEAFARVGMANFNPHSFRKTLVRLALDRDLDDATMKSWSQNLGHEDIRTTLMSYGEVPTHRQRDLIRAAGHNEDDDRLALRLGRDLLAKVRARDAG